MSGPLAVGHRGAPTAAVENTIGSIGKAVGAGAHWVEVDVKLTADHVPVLLHDRTLRRIWGLDRQVARTPLADLPGRTWPREPAPAREPRVPTLREALDHIRGSGARLLIDLPSLPEAAPSVSLVRDLGMIHETAFTGDTDALAEVRAQAPDAVISLTWDQRLLPGEATLARVAPQYVNQPYALLDAPAAAAIHAAGLLAAAYTVDDPDEMRRMADIGVDAITSNEIALLVATLAARAAGGTT